MQFVCIACAVTCKATGVHTGLFVVLAAVGSICEDCSNLNLRVEALEYLIVADENGHRLHGKQCVELTVECRLIEIIKDEFGNLRHAVLVGIIHILITVVILHKETKHVFIGNGILYQVFVKTVAKDFFCSVSVHRIFNKDRCASKTEYLRVVEELHDILVTFSEMTSMTFIENHHDTRMAYFLNTTAIPLLADSGIKFLYGCYDNL